MNKREVLKLMVLRKPVFSANKLHPKAQLKREQYSKTPEPLKFKVQTTEDPKPQDLLKPLGVKVALPFSVLRSWNGNLPVYRDFKNRSEIPRTVIRHIEGDLSIFKNELSKVVSNATIIEKVGRVEVQGSHKESVLKWLRGLGF